MEEYDAVGIGARRNGLVAADCLRDAEPGIVRHDGEATLLRSAAR